MKISIHAVGRMKAGPEKDLVAHYFDRFAKSGPPLGLEFSGVTEIAESRAANADERMREEGQHLLSFTGDKTALILLQASLPAMEAASYGRVVLISSRAVLGLPTRTSYATTKAGMLGMARTWALELAPQGITVNVVAPGPIETDNFYSVVPRGQGERVAQAIPVKRLGQPGDVARAVMFFAHRDAGFVTGQVLYVCGGTSVGSLTL